MVPKLEDANWAPTGRGGRNLRAAESLTLLRTLKVGDVKRLVHDDVSCHGSKNCTVKMWISRYRRLYGWEVEMYHEKLNVAVLRRVK